MKSKICLLLLSLAALAAQAWEGDVAVETPNNMLILHAREGQDLRMAYYGMRVTDLRQLRDAGADLNSSLLPAFGTVDMVQLPALQVMHADGDLNLELTTTDYTSRTEGDAVLHTFTMRDRLQPVTVRLHLKAYQRVDIIEMWTEIENGEKRPITLKRYDSGHLTLRQGEVWITHMHGNWAAEAEPMQEALTQGVKIIRNTDGARNAHLDAPEVMISLDGVPQRTSAGTYWAHHRRSALLEWQLRTPIQYTVASRAPLLCRYRPAILRVHPRPATATGDAPLGAHLLPGGPEWCQP